MDAEEARLRFALVANIGNASRVFTAADVACAVAAATGLSAATFSVTPTYPQSFLINCPSQDIRGRVLNCNPVPLASTYVSMRPWTRMIRANLKVLYYKVGLELDGIPEHAWDLDTARQLLARYAWVERLDQATASKTDMSIFKLTAWTRNPHGIPPALVLSITEPEPQIAYSDAVMQRGFGNLEPYLREKRVLDYPINVHLRSIADFRPRSPSTEPSSPSDDGDSGPDGNPDSSYGFRRGVGPRLSGLPRLDNPGAGHGGAAGCSGGADARRAHHHRSIGTPPRNHVTTEASALQNHFPKVDSNKSVTTRAAEDGDKEEPVCAPSSGVNTLPGGATTTDPTVRATEHDSQVAFELEQHRNPPIAVVLDPMLIEVDCTTQTPTGHPLEDSMHPPRDELTEGLASLATCQQVVVEPEGEPEGETAPSDVTAPSAHDDGPGCPQASWAGKQMGHDDEDLSDTSPPGFSRKGRSVEHDATTGEEMMETIHTESSMQAEQDGVEVDGHSPPRFSRRGRADDHHAKLQAFLEEVQCKIQTPLVPKPPRARKLQPPLAQQEMPKRSERLANHPLAKVASSKRAEVLLMRRFSEIPDTEPLTAEDKLAYDKLYKEGLAANNFEAMHDLIPALRNASPILGMQA
ncbi:unnamed protein product [Urochloa humidicola]